MTLRLGGDGAITGCTSLENPDLTVSGLTISGSFDAEKVLVASGTAAAPSYTFSGDTDNGLYYAGTNSIGVSTAGTSAIVVDSSQRVGIGTTSPGKLLEIGTGGAVENTNYMVRINRGVTGEYADFSADNGFATIDGINGSGGGVRFLGDGNERARIDTSGRLLVGTSSASTGSSAQYAILQAQGSTNSSTGGGIFSINLGNSGNTLVSDNYVGGLYYASTVGEFASIECRADGTCGSGDYPGRLVFSTTANGASSPTERMRITSDGTIRLYNSPGIDFSQIQTNAAGMTSETLDSYEEGTFTPYYGNVSAIGYATQTGRYVKVGKMVTVYIMLSTVNAGSPTGTSGVVIAGLPFTAQNSNNAGTNMLVLTHDNRFTNNPRYGQIQSGNGAQIVLFKDNDMSSASKMTASDFNPTNTSNFNLLSVNFTYEVA